MCIFYSHRCSCVRRQVICGDLIFNHGLYSFFETASFIDLEVYHFKLNWLVSKVHHYLLPSSSTGITNRSQSVWIFTVSWGSTQDPTFENSLCELGCLLRPLLFSCFKNSFIKHKQPSFLF